MQRNRCKVIIRFFTNVVIFFHSSFQGMSLEKALNDSAGVNDWLLEGHQGGPDEGNISSFLEKEQIAR